MTFGFMIFESCVNFTSFQKLVNSKYYLKQYAINYIDKQRIKSLRKFDPSRLLCF